MLRLLRLAWAGALVAAMTAALGGCGGADNTPSQQTRAALVEDQYTYHVGVLAYLYGYPLVDAYRRQHNQQLEASETALPPLDPMRSLGFFEILNLQLKANPPEPGSELLLAQFNAIGVGPNSSFDNAALTPAAKRGLERAIRDARVMLEAATPGSGGLLGRAAEYQANAE